MNDAARLRLAAAILAPTPHVAPSWLRAATLGRFQLSRNPLAQLDDGERLLESCFAPPGRYVGEMLRRLRRLKPDARRYLVYNPYYTLSPRLTDAILAAAFCAPVDDGPFLLLTDAAARPLAYAFSPAAAAAAPPQHFGLLSTFDAAVDERLLTASFGVGRQLTIAHDDAAAPAAHGFWPLSPALAAATARAAERLEAQPFASRAALLHGARVAVVGYHAGDVLFWAQALAFVDGVVDSGVDSGVEALVTLAPYGDIARWARPELTTWTVALPVPYRPGSTVRDEHAHLWRCVTELELHDPEPRFWHLYRPFRDYRPPLHHLREAMAFALGAPGHGPRPPLPLPQAARAMVPNRVVVHFEGGWPLKELPPARRGPLLRRLQAAGYAPVILGSPEPACPDIAAQPYRNFDDFRALATSAAALVGTDSFPAHCAQALGVPTVQLFGPTHAAHSSGPPSPRYRALQRPLPCIPCVDQTRCAVDGGALCHAHVGDDAILAALADLLDDRSCKAIA